MAPNTAFDEKKFIQYLRSFAVLHERGPFDFPNSQPTHTRGKHYCCFRKKFNCCKDGTHTGSFLIFRGKLLGICLATQKIIKQINRDEFEGKNERLIYFKSFYLATQALNKAS